MGTAQKLTQASATLLAYKNGWATKRPTDILAKYATVKQTCSPCLRKEFRLRTDCRIGVRLRGRGGAPLRSMLQVDIPNGGVPVRRQFDESPGVIRQAVAGQRRQRKLARGSPVDRCPNDDRHNESHCECRNAAHRDRPIDSEQQY
jgi:hypothetical protein